MPSREADTNLRLVLAMASCNSAIADYLGENNRYVVRLPADSMMNDAGTPAAALESGTIHPKCLTYHAQLKLRNVHVSNEEALAQVTQVLHGKLSYRKRVPRLASSILKVVEKKNLLRGYSALYVAVACEIAAEKATQKIALFSGEDEKLGIQSRAAGHAYAELKQQSVRSGRMHDAVTKHIGNNHIFPGKPQARKSRYARSTSNLEKLRQKVAERGHSPLRAVVNASDFTAPAEKITSPKVQGLVQRYYGGQPSEGFDPEGYLESPRDNGYTMDAEFKHLGEYDGDLLSMGVALGNLMIC